MDSYIAEQSNTSSDKGGDNCIIYFIILLPFLPLLTGRDLVGYFIIFCKRHKLLRWLVYDIWSD
jgi:hypothetical protein